MKLWPSFANLKPISITRIAYEMKKANLADPFISPVTGRIFGENSLPGLQSGFIWIGDSFNRPVQTDRLVATNFIIGDAVSKSTYPAAQYLSDLPDGMLRKTGGKLSQAIDGEHYVYRLPERHIWIGDNANHPIALPNIAIGNLPGITHNSLWIGDANNRPIETARILQANLPTLPERHIWIGNAEADPIALPNIQIGNLPGLTHNRLWAGDAQGRPVEVTRIQEENLPDLPERHIWVGQLNPYGRPVSIQLVPVGTGMAKIQGDGTFALAVADQDYATVDTLERIKEEARGYAEDASASATAAEESAVAAEGSATAAAAEATAAGASAAAAGASATAAGGSAVAAGVSAGAAALSAISASSSSSSASSSADSASTSATNASTSATQAQNTLNTLLSTGLNVLPCSGDVSINHHKITNLSPPINNTDAANKEYVDGKLTDVVGKAKEIMVYHGTQTVISFAENPTIPGSGFMKIPIGNNTQRPASPEAGMFRFNTN